MNRLPRVVVAGWLLADVAAAFAGSGFGGVASVRRADGGIGAPIPDVEIRFLPEGGGPAATARTDARGSYRLELPRGRYRAVASHPAFEDYWSLPGFFVVRGGYQTENFFLREPATTTVLVLRHAEKGPAATPDQQTPLSPAGEARARELAHVALKAGVSAIYVTDYLRTRQTAKPLAKALQIEPAEYTTASSLAAAIDADHRGDVVLVVSHRGIVEEILGRLSGASVPDFLAEEFDNLFLVTTQGTAGDVLNLQYAAPSLPDSPARNVGARTTVLLVPPVEPGTAGNERAQALKQALRKAGVDKIYCNRPTSTVDALAAELGLTPTAYGAADLPAFARRVLADNAGKTVLICARPKQIVSISKAVRGYPTIPVLTDECDNLVVVTLEGSTDARVTSLQYGSASR